MPEIPVDSTDWQNLWDATVALWFDPTHPEIRRVLADEIQGQVLYGLIDRFGAEHFKLDNEAVRLLHQATLIDPSNETPPQLPVLDAFIAGDILLTTLRLAIHMPEKASIENALRIVAAREKKAGRPSSRASLMKIWAKNKSVSHLAAANALSIPMLRALARAVQSISKMQQIKIPDKPNAVSKTLMRRWARGLEKQARHVERAVNKRLPKLFANAERLRQLGQKHFSATQKKSGKSLLEPNETWTVPKKFNLPRVRINFSRLTKDERALLEKRKESNSS